MSSWNWPTDPVELIRPFEVQHQNPTSSALFAWAAWAVDSLHYLDDIDRTYDASHMTIGGHRPDVVDIAHARWATSTCITALDLCAAGLGRAFCGHSKTHELDLTDFDRERPLKQQKQKERDRRRSQLPLLAQQWIDDVCADFHYKQIKSARDWLTHSRITRHLTIGGTPQRLQLQLENTRLGVRHLVDHARDVGTRHVSTLLGLLPKL